MVREEIKKQVEIAVLEEFQIKVSEIQIEKPQNKQWGEYSCNVAFKLAKQIGKSPVDIASIISTNIQNRTIKSLHGWDAPLIDSVSFVAPGFINFKISKLALLEFASKLIENPKQARSVYNTVTP